jgi:hypothetical protein
MAHKTLLKDPQVRRWYDNVSRGSELTAQAYLRRFGLFCRRSHSRPARLLGKEPRDIHNLLMTQSHNSKEKAMPVPTDNE